LIAIVLAAGLQLLDKPRLYRLAPWLYALSILLLVGVLFFGREVNGARAWFVSPFAFSPRSSPSSP